MDFAPRTVTCLRHRFPRASLPMSMVSSHEPGDRWRMDAFYYSDRVSSQAVVNA